MMPRHHPLEECLLSYANGCMGEAESLLIATHLAFCPECRKVAKIGECVGGRLLQDGDAVPVSDDCKAKLFAALPEAGCAAREAAERASPDCFVPEPLRGYLDGAGCKDGLQRLTWETIAPGWAEHKLPLTACCLRRGAAARMVHLQGAADFTLAEAGGRQAVLVLCGSLRRGAAVYETGDLVCGRDGRLFQAGNAGCYALAVAQAGKRGWLGRFLRLMRCS